MKISTKQGKWSLKDAEGLIVPVAEKEDLPKGLPKFAEQLMKDAAENKEFTGKVGEMKSVTIPQKQKKTLRHLVFVGIGKKDAVQPREIGELVGQAVRVLHGQKAATIAIWMRQTLTDHVEDAELLAENIASSATLSAYEYPDYLKKKPHAIKSATVFVEDKDVFASVRDAAKRGALIGEKVNDSRSLANTPSNEMTPKKMTEFVKEATEKEDISVRALGEKEMKDLGMGAILGVSKGSGQEAQFIIMEYFGADDKDEAPYVLVGKGVTFDTGGISIKPSSNMHEMKFDMCGGASAIGIVRAAAALKLPINVVGLIPASENMPGHEAYKPGDVLRAMDGSTIEVLNTDAEGRLLMADALVYARDYKPKAVFDIATLTGACAVALYDSAAGLFTEHDDIADGFKEASEATGDIAWRLPMPERYKELLKSSVADIPNIASTPYGGALTAAQFLNHFVDNKYPWAHIDIAGVAWALSGTKSLTAGSTGAGIRVVVEWLRAQTS